MKYLFIYLFIYAFIYSFIHSFIFIYSHSCTNNWIHTCDLFIYYLTICLYYYYYYYSTLFPDSRSISKKRTIQTKTVHIKKRQLCQYFLIEDWYRTSVSLGFVNNIIILLCELSSRQINLYIKFLIKAGNDCTLTLQNKLLLLHHLGLFSRILIQSLYATWSLHRLSFLNLNHKGAV